MSRSPGARAAGVLSLILALALTTGGCAWSIGGEKSRTTRPTVAQELRELAGARDEGLISEAEYEKAKASLLSSGGRRDD